MVFGTLILESCKGSLEGASCFRRPPTLMEELKAFRSVPQASLSVEFLVLLRMLTKRVGV